MRQNELLGFNKLLKTLDLEVDFNDKFTNGQNWEDVPFHNLKSLKVGSWNDPYRDFETPPNWFEILKTIDELLVKDNDYHHKWIGGFNHNGRGSYYVSMES
jgi:hypothetical protein